jgi:hypothetical protein
VTPVRVTAEATPPKRNVTRRFFVLDNDPSPSKSKGSYDLSFVANK